MITNSPITPDHILQAERICRFGTINQPARYGEIWSTEYNENAVPGASQMTQQTALRQNIHL